MCIFGVGHRQGFPCWMGGGSGKFSQEEMFELQRGMEGKESQGG